jgi:hypothetical protein
MSSTTAQNGTAWPQSAGASIHSLIKDIRSTGQADVKPRALKTPFSLQVIQSTATWLAKGWAAAVAASGGATALIALITGVWIGIGTDPVRIAVVASAALVLAAVAISIAIIVRGDLVARATGAAARHHAERAIASSALNNYSSFWFPGYSSEGRRTELSFRSPTSSRPVPTGSGSGQSRPAAARRSSVRTSPPSSRPACRADGLTGCQRVRPQTGQAPGPWAASTRSATAICSLFVARSARGA